MGRHLITLYALDRHRAEEALPALARALDGGTIAMPDEAGMVEVELSADSPRRGARAGSRRGSRRGAEERLTFPETTGTGYAPPGGRAPAPDEQPDPEPPHLERGSPREEGPAPSDEQG